MKYDFYQTSNSIKTNYGQMREDGCVDETVRTTTDIKRLTPTQMVREDFIKAHNQANNVTMKEWQNKIRPQLQFML